MSSETQPTPAEATAATNTENPPAPDASATTAASTTANTKGTEVTACAVSDQGGGSNNKDKTIAETVSLSVADVKAPAEHNTNNSNNNNNNQQQHLPPKSGVDKGGMNGTNGAAAKPVSQGRPAPEASKPTMTPPKQTLSVQADVFTLMDETTTRQQPSAVFTPKQRPPKTPPMRRNNAMGLPPQQPLPPPPPPMYQAPFMVSPLMPSTLQPPPPPPPPPPGHQGQIYIPPLGMHPTPSPMVSPFLAGFAGVQPPAPAPAPPFIQPPCAPLLFNSPMNIPMQTMMMAKSNDSSLFSSLLANGAMGAPPPPSLPLPPPPPPSLVQSLQQHQQQQQQPQQHPQGMPLSRAQNARVSVGNATLAALISKEPPKFACVLLSGIPAVGKTTMGRELVNELRRDGLGWIFFSGADFLSGITAKRPSWEITREVFDALEKRLDELLEQQRTDRNVKGLVIDKNVKGIEDIYYLASLLKARNIPFVGIVGMEADNDDVLLKRMNGGEELREKLKYHRVIHARVRGLAKSVGMYHEVDATKSKEDVLNSLCTMTLGCCAQPPQRGIRTDLYAESTSIKMVDNHTEYCNVITRVLDVVKSAKGATHYLGITEFTPLSTREMNDKNRVTAIKTYYGVRRLNDGTRHLLVYHDSKLYLVPRHLKAVLRIPDKAWLGSPLDSVHFFALEGDLVRLPRECGGDRFLVFDALFWSEAGDTGTNKILPMDWTERQAFLASHLLAENNISSSLGSDCVVVAHQATMKLGDICELLNVNDSSLEGILFQPTSPAHAYDKVYVWRPPAHITVDFRIGALKSTTAEETATTPTATEDAAVAVGGGGSSGSGGGVNVGKESDTQGMRVNGNNSPSSSNISHPCTQLQLLSQLQDSFMMNSIHSLGQSVNTVGTPGRSLNCENVPTRTFELEVYDKFEKEYVQYEDCTVEVKNPDVVEGCICTCALADERGKTWKYQCIRYDALRPAYKRDVASLLDHCIIPKAKLWQWLVHEKIVSPALNDTSTLRSLAPPLPPPPPPPLLSSGSASTKTPPHHPSSLPTYNTAMLQQSNLQPHSSIRMSSSGGPDSMAYHSLLLGGSTPSSHQYHQGNTLPTDTNPFHAIHGALHAAPEPRAEALKPSSEAHKPSSLTPLELLSAMVPSVYVVRSDDSEEKPKSTTKANHNRNNPNEQKSYSLHSLDMKGRNAAASEREREQDKRGSKRASGQDKGRGGKKANAGSGQCTQCHKKKESEDLRLDKRDSKQYCYSCWAKVGWEFCRECGEFKEGRREASRRRVGEFYCNDCWSSFKQEEEGEEGKKDGRSKKSGSEQKQQRTKQKQQKEQKTKEKDGAAAAAEAEAGVGEDGTVAKVVTEKEKKRDKRRPSDRKKAQKSCGSGSKEPSPAIVKKEEEGETKRNSASNVNHLEEKKTIDAKPKERKDKAAEAEAAVAVLQKEIVSLPHASQEAVAPNKLDVAVE